MSSQATKPNIILVVADQHRADFLGCADRTPVQTPQFDQMAARGRRFTNCASVAPLCMPYRCSLQTGLYAFQHGQEDNRGHLELDVLEGPTLAEQFVANGYQTAYFGKCHWNSDHGSGEGDFVPPKRRLGWQHWEGWNNGHFSYDMPCYTEEGQREYRWKGLYEPEIMTQRAIRYLAEDQDTDKPFLMQINWHPPHNATTKKEFEAIEGGLEKAKALNEKLGLGLPEEAYSNYWWFCQTFPLWLLFPVVPQKFLDLYDTEDFQIPSNINERFEKAYKWFVKEYAAMVTSLDEQMGVLQNYLESSGLAENTIVIYTSDHGDYLGTNPGQTPFRGKGAATPESMRVPFIIDGPQFADGPHIDERPCNTMDLYATLFDLAGIESQTRLRGHSLLKPAEKDYCMGSTLSRRSVFDGELTYSICPTEDSKWRSEGLSDCRLPGTPGDLFAQRTDLEERETYLRERLLELLAAEGETPEII